MYAVVKFGSYCRQEEDNMSDKDLLLVCEKSVQYGLRTIYENRGYSVSAYTPRQLYFMKKKGSLFLQHLKNESSIMLDDGGLFKNFINECKFIKPEGSEIRKCEHSITHVILAPDIYYLKAWKIDFLYCLIRDFVIKKIATKGYLAFGLKDITDWLSTEQGVNQTVLDELYSAREIKNQYRGGVNSSTAHFQNVLSAYRELLKSLDFVIDNDSFSSFKVWSQFVLLSHDCGYMLLRTLEAANSYYLKSRGRKHPHHDRVQALTQSPNTYSSSSAFRKVELSSSLSQILSEI